MNKVVLSLILMFPLLICAQIEIEHSHCNCIDYIDAIEPVLSGSYERKCDEQLIEKGQFLGGDKIGLWESYSMTGEKIREFNYNDSGRLNGVVRLYYSDGTMKLEGDFIDNKREGIWTYFTNRGKLQKQGEYKEGVPTGIWRIYNEKGKKEEIVYDYSISTYVKNNSALRYFENEEIIQNDNKGEWFILFYPDIEESDDFSPIESIGLLMDEYVNHVEIPLEFWDTYASYNYESKLIYENGALSDIEVIEIDGHLDGVAALPLIVITNEKDKLQRVEHSDFSKKMLEYKIKEALYLSGPLIEPKDTVVLYTPFVVNQIKNRR